MNLHSLLIHLGCSLREHTPAACIEPQGYPFCYVVAEVVEVVLWNCDRSCWLGDYTDLARWGEMVR